MPNSVPKGGKRDRPPVCPIHVVNAEGRGAGRGRRSRTRHWYGPHLMKNGNRHRVRLLWALAVVGLGLAPAVADAQQGKVNYLRSVRFDFHVPERWAQMRDRMPTESTAALELAFDGTRSLMRRLDENGEPRGPRARDGDRMDRRALGMLMRMRQGSASRSDQENIREAYVDFSSGATTEIRDFMGRTFLIKGERPAYQWKLGSEQREFLGFMVQKATATLDGRDVEAWFTPQIPVQAGPGEFGGLPGLILVLTVDEGHTVYSATEVDLAELADGSIAPPAEGEEVSREEYERIVAEKIEELRTLRGEGARRRPFNPLFQ